MSTGILAWSFTGAHERKHLLEVAAARWIVRRATEPIRPYGRKEVRRCGEGFRGAIYGTMVSESTSTFCAATTNGALVINCVASVPSPATASPRGSVLISTFP
jgi:hypothetical protein